MTDINEKLNIFTSLVLEDASKKSRKLMNDLEKEREARIEQKENEFLEESYLAIQKSIEETRKEAYERILHENINAKKQILLKREEIIADIMKTVYKRIIDFHKNNGYEVWLMNKIRKAILELDQGEKKVYVCADDMKYQEKIEALSDENKITLEIAPEKDFLGGVRVYNIDKKIISDYSFNEILAEQKKLFLQGSGLSIS